MNTRLYVGNLSFSTTEGDLIDLFSKHGAVAEASLMLDPVTRRARGFAFVTMQSSTEAQSATDALNGFSFQGRNLTVNDARSNGGRFGGGEDRAGARRKFNHGTQRLSWKA